MKRVVLPVTVVLIAGVALAQSGTQLDLANATIADLNAAFRNGTLTAEALTEMYLARIAAYDKQGPTINAVISLNPKALSEARDLDAERSAGRIRGPLHGIPIVLKDNFNTRDLPTTGGSQLLEGSIPPADAFVVRKLRDAGAIILAKTNLSEFASGGGSVIGARDPAILRGGPDHRGLQLAGRPDTQPSRSDARAWRLERRHRRVDRSRIRAVRSRHRYRRLDPRPGRREWRGRPQDDARAREPDRPAAAGQLRHGRSDRAQCVRHCGGLECAGRRRPCRFVHEAQRRAGAEGLHGVSQDRVAERRPHRDWPRLRRTRSRNHSDHRGRHRHAENNSGRSSSIPSGFRTICFR